MTPTSSASLVKVYSRSIMSHPRTILPKKNTGSWYSSTEISMRRNGENWQRFCTGKLALAGRTKIASIITMPLSGKGNTKANSDEEEAGLEEEVELVADAELLLTWSGLIHQVKMGFLLP